MPVAPYPPLGFVIMTYNLFEGLLHLGEAEVPGMKSLLNVQLDIAHSTEPFSPQKTFGYQNSFEFRSWERLREQVIIFQLHAGFAIVCIR